MASGIDPDALRAAREKAGLTQHELARRIGAAGGERVSRWELGMSMPRPAFVVEIARVLKVPRLSLIRFDGAAPDLRALRLAAGLSVPELVAKVGVAAPTYYAWEQGRWSQMPSRAVNAMVDGLVMYPVWQADPVHPRANHTQYPTPITPPITHVMTT